MSGRGALTMVESSVRDLERRCAQWWGEERECGRSSMVDGVAEERGLALKSAVERCEMLRLGPLPREEPGWPEKFDRAETMERSLREEEVRSDFSGEMRPVGGGGWCMSCSAACQSEIQPWISRSRSSAGDCGEGERLSTTG